MVMKKHNIVLASDTPEAESFVRWLEFRGHTATVGNTDCTTVDGDCDACNEMTGQRIISELWDEYCREGDDDLTVV